MTNKKISYSFLAIYCVLFLLMLNHCKRVEPKQEPKKKLKLSQSTDSIQIFHENKNTWIKFINPTFLGNEKRNFYGSDVPEKLDIIWKKHLGSGKTKLGKNKMVLWSGAGWTGQPLLIEENGHLYIIQGAYDHHVKKIDAENGEIIWEYDFGDVIKGTGTLWINHKTQIPELQVMLIQGSRQSERYYKKTAPALRGISYLTGKPVWKLDCKRTKSYSRDADASALIIQDTAYIGLENALFTVFDPDPRKAKYDQNLVQPVIFDQETLYTAKDAVKHAGNLVVEASPARIGNHIYLAAGAGHVYGYNLTTKEVDWDFYIGSDMDGSPVVTADSCLLISVEKQYVPSAGGLLKLNPARKPENAIEWYFPTKNKNFADWKGGIIGTPGITDFYDDGKKHRAACIAIDGNLYVIDYKKITEEKVLMYDGKTKAYTPKLIFKYPTGPSISSCLMIQNYIVVAGYNGLFVFKEKDDSYTLVDKFLGTFEATPFVWKKRIYVASRDGHLYCFGEK